MASLSEQLTVYAFLREILNDDIDYTSIIAIITEFFKQGYAKYFDERLNKDFMKELRFGDIVRKLDDAIYVLNSANKLVYLGGYCQTGGLTEDMQINISIPLSICKGLSNAVSFYSKIHKNEAYPRSTDLFAVYAYIYLYISHDDEFIIDKLGGPLKPEYESIGYYARDHNFTHLTIEYTNDMSITLQSPDVERNNYKDVIKYHKIRLDKGNMTKIKVVCVGQWFSEMMHPIVPISILWEFRGNESWHACQYYVGPKNEETKMINEIKRVYKGKEIEISTVNVEESDLIDEEEDF